MLFKFVGLFLFLFVGQVETKIQLHELDIQWLNEFWHRTAIMALLRVSFFLGVLFVSLR